MARADDLVDRLLVKCLDRLLDRRILDHQKAPHLRIAAIRRGLGFAWVPESEIGDGLESGALKVLPLEEGVERLVDLHLIYADGQYAGQAARYLGERIREAAAVPCPGVTVS